MNLMSILMPSHNLGYENKEGIFVRGFPDCDNRALASGSLIFLLHSLAIVMSLFVSFREFYSAVLLSAKMLQNLARKLRGRPL